MQIFKDFHMTLLLILFVLFQAGCSSSVKSLGSFALPAPVLMTTIPATPAQCPSGGNTYLIYSDLNNSGKFESNDTIISTQSICNGLNSLVSSVRATVPTTACLSGSGLQVNSGLDLNGNGVLDPSEITSSQIVCDGQNGTNASVTTAQATSDQCSAGGVVITTVTGTNPPSSSVVCNGTNGQSASISTTLATPVQCPTGGYAITTTSPGQSSQQNLVCNGAVGAAGAAGAIGATGPAGSNGYNMVFSIIPANTTVCPAGGSTIVMALDTYRTGVYSALDPDQQSTTICNGQSAPVSAYQTVQPIMPCGNTVAYKEVLLLLADGQVLSSFSADMSGDETRLAFLTDGTYEDTDSSQCIFSLSTSGSTRSISWFGSVQMHWQMSSN